MGNSAKKWRKKNTSKNNKKHDETCGKVAVPETVENGLEQDRNAEVADINGQFSQTVSTSEVRGAGLVQSTEKEDVFQVNQTAAAMEKLDDELEQCSTVKDVRIDPSDATETERKPSLEIKDTRSGLLEKTALGEVENAYIDLGDTKQSEPEQLPKAFGVRMDLTDTEKIGSDCSTDARVAHLDLLKAKAVEGEQPVETEDSCSDSKETTKMEFDHSAETKEAFVNSSGTVEAESKHSEQVEVACTSSTEMSKVAQEPPVETNDRCDRLEVNPVTSTTGTESELKETAEVRDTITDQTACAKADDERCEEPGDICIEPLIKMLTSLIDYRSRNKEQIECSDLRSFYDIAAERCGLRKFSTLACLVSADRSYAVDKSVFEDFFTALHFNLEQTTVAFAAWKGFILFRQISSNENLVYDETYQMENLQKEVDFLRLVVADVVEVSGLSCSCRRILNNCQLLLEVINLIETENDEVLLKNHCVFRTKPGISVREAKELSESLIVPQIFRSVENILPNLQILNDYLKPCDVTYEVGCKIIEVRDVVDKLIDIRMTKAYFQLLKKVAYSLNLVVLDRLTEFSLRGRPRVGQDFDFAVKVLKMITTFPLMEALEAHYKAKTIDESYVRQLSSCELNFMLKRQYYDTPVEKVSQNPVEDLQKLASDKTRMVRLMIDEDARYLAWLLMSSCISNGLLEQKFLNIFGFDSEKSLLQIKVLRILSTTVNSVNTMFTQPLKTPFLVFLARKELQRIGLKQFLKQGGPILLLSLCEYDSRGRRVLSPEELINEMLLPLFIVEGNKVWCAETLLHLMQSPHVAINWSFVYEPLRTTNKDASDSNSASIKTVSIARFFVLLICEYELPGRNCDSASQYHMIEELFVAAAKAAKEYENQVGVVLDSHAKGIIMTTIEEKCRNCFAAEYFLKALLRPITTEEPQVLPKPETDDLNDCTEWLCKLLKIIFCGISGALICRQAMEDVLPLVEVSNMEIAVIMIFDEIPGIFLSLSTFWVLKDVVKSCGKTRTMAKFTTKLTQGKLEGFFTALLWAALLAEKYEDYEDGALKEAVVKMKCRLIDKFCMQKKIIFNEVIAEATSEEDVRKKFLDWRGKNEFVDRALDKMLQPLPGGCVELVHADLKDTEQAGKEQPLVVEVPKQEVAEEVVCQHGLFVFNNTESEEKHGSSDFLPEPEVLMKKGKSERCGRMRMDDESLCNEMEQRATESTAYLQRCKSDSAFYHKERSLIHSNTGQFSKSWELTSAKTKSLVAQQCSRYRTDESSANSSRANWQAGGYRYPMHIPSVDDEKRNVGDHKVVGSNHRAAALLDLDGDPEAPGGDRPQRPDWNKSQMRCFKCGQKGHFYRDCTESKKKQRRKKAPLRKTSRGVKTDDSQFPSGMSEKPGTTAWQKDSRQREDYLPEGGSQSHTLRRSFRYRDETRKRSLVSDGEKLSDH